MTISSSCTLIKWLGMCIYRFYNDLGAFAALCRNSIVLYIYSITEMVISERIGYTLCHRHLALVNGHNRIFKITNNRFGTKC